MRPFMYAAGLTLGLLQSAFAGVIDLNNILVSIDTSNNNAVHEYTRAGSLVQTIIVPNPSGGTRSWPVRGVTALNNGSVATFDGVFSPFVNIVNPVTNTNTAYTTSSWNTTNTFVGGNIASLGTMVYVNDMFYPGGLIRFNRDNGAATRFGPQNVQFIEVAVGRNGVIYGVPGGSFPGAHNVYTFNASTLAQTSNFNLTGYPTDGVFTLAVAANGDIYAGGGTDDSIITRHSSTGALLGTLTLPGTGVADIDIDWNGNLVFSSGNLDGTGNLYLANSTLSSSTLIATTATFGHVSFAPEPSSLFLAASGVTLAGIRLLKCRRGIKTEVHRG